MRKVKNQGNALMEYSLPLVILLVMSGLLGTFGGWVQNFQSYLQNSTNSQIDNHMLKIPALGVGVLPSTGSTSGVVPSTAASAGNTVLMVSPPGTGQQQICLSSSKMCINIPEVTGSGTVSDTLGGLGGNLVTSYASVFDQIAAQLKAQNADPALVTLITNLAQNGHNIGNMLNTVETVCKTGGSPACDFKSIGGQLDDSMIQSSHAVNGAISATINTTRFQEALQAVNNYFSLHPNSYQDIQGIIQLEASQITNIGQGLNLGIQMTSGKNSLGNNNFNVTGTANNAKLVNQDANTICANGGNQGVCIQPTS